MSMSGARKPDRPERKKVNLSETVAKPVRKFVFDYFLENSRAPVLEEIMRTFHLVRSEARDVVEELEAAHHVIRLPGTQRILMANPFSALDTPFAVKIGNKRYFGACAWDAVAFHVMVGRESRVDSFCHHCGEPIRIEFRNGRAVSTQPSDPLVFLSLPAAKWWENIVITCANNMVFLSSRRHLDDWLKENSVVSGEALSLEQTLKISLPIYKEKMNLDYARPTKEELMIYWDSIGLHGDFWKL